MELLKISENILYVKDTTNIPIINLDGSFIIFDSPIDRDKAKKLRKILDEKSIKPDILILSHHHADHTGGAYFLKEYYGLKVMTSSLEKILIENPFIEPIYLSEGANPPKEFLSKWVLSNPVKVDELLSPGSKNINGRELEILDLSGHSIGMIGIHVNKIIFSADAFFSLEILEKYGIPYFHDKEGYLEKMNKIKSLDFEYILPSHGSLYSKEEALKIIDENTRVVLDIEEKILKEITGTKRTLEEIIIGLKIEKDDLVVSHLIKSSVQAILFSLMNKETIRTETKSCITYFVK